MLEAIVDVLGCERGVVGLYDPSHTPDGLRRIIRVRGDQAPGEVIISRTLIDATLTRHFGGWVDRGLSVMSTAVLRAQSLDHRKPFAFLSPPITAEQLGELLYRCARERPIGKNAHGQEISSRPYPSAGGLYELEVYAVVHACEWLCSGLYHYVANEHALTRLSERTPMVEQHLHDAAVSPPELPQVLLVLAARFQRVSWKYESVSYSLVLKDAGVLLQTMYLVATAMSLSPCARGGGDADLFARAAGFDCYVETSVAEFLLGSRP
jgi:SagB-type dehydrogenase family enzyme